MRERERVRMRAQMDADEARSALVDVGDTRLQHDTDCVIGSADMAAAVAAPASR